MIREQILIQNKLGLHTRAAAKLVDLAKRYGCKIELNFRDRTVDCKSIMGVITLGAQKDHSVNIVLNGDDEQAAFDAITALVNNKFGED